MGVVVDKSYRLGHFRDNEGSLERLKRQAGVVLDVEFDQLRSAGLAEGMRVMDIGCGPGIIASEIVKRMSPSRFVAADCNEVSLAETRLQFASRGITNAEVRQINIYEKRTSKEDLFDFIYARLVFQHLSEPMTALANVQSRLERGGRLCICDVDDRWLTISPEPPELSSFMRRVARAQEFRGGDRGVGTKLASYLIRSGFQDVRSGCILLSSDLVGKEQFCDLVLGYKLEVVPERELSVAEDEVRAIKESVMSSQGWGAIAVFFVSGASAVEE